MLTYFVLVVVCLLSSVQSFKIGAFNVKVFGASKAGDPEVLAKLAKIVLRYDILLIQEIKDVKQEAIFKLRDEVNSISESRPYKTILSERLGRSSQKEQYCFFYRDDGNIQVGKPDPSTFNEDSNDPFEREPFLVKFNVKNTAIKEFVLGGVHIKPTDAVKELTALPDVFYQAQRTFKSDNVLIMGDLNADCAYVPKKAWKDLPIKTDASFHWLISDDIDTTVASTTDCAYDRIIILGEAFRAAIVPNSAKPFYFDQEWKLDSSQALGISDHYPVEVELKQVAHIEVTDSSSSNDFSVIMALVTILSAGIIPILMFASTCIIK